MSRRRSGRVAEGVVRALGRGGDGVAEMPGGLWFVPDVLPGERVRAREISARGGTVHAKCVDVLEKSPHRVEPECSHQRACGGCPFMHMTASFEQSTKRAWLSDLLERLSVSTVDPGWVESPRAEGYRTRARLFWARAGRRVDLGFRRARSRTLVDIDRCLVLDERLDAALAGLRSRLGAHLTGEGEVSLSLGTQGTPVAVLRTEAPQAPELYAACAAWHASGEVAGLGLAVGAGTEPASWGEPREILRAGDGQPLHGTVGGFSQANAGVNALLVAHVSDLCQSEGKRVHELYAGHGNFSVVLARGASHYTAVEQDAAAARACEQNLLERGLEAKVIAGDAATHVGRGPLDVLLLDPPRTGARGVLARAAQTRKPARIVYVSCDLATLERDLREALSAGYVLDHVTGFDMFPRTAQLETVVRLVRQP